MNFLLRITTFLPTLIIYLRGSVMFGGGKYEAAIQAFEKCLKHPSFNNELVFSYYGQSLCAVGRLNEASPYLIKASQLFEAEGWLFKDEQIMKLANNTISALKHIDENTDIKIDRSVFDAKSRLNDN